MLAVKEQNNFLCYGEVAVAQKNLTWDRYWIRVNTFYIEISKKVGQNDQFIIPLDIKRFEHAAKETSSQNSIYIETSALTNNLKIYIRTTNRLDILNLYQSIETGIKILKDAIDGIKIDRQVSYDVETSSGFFGRKEKMHFKMTMEGIDVTGGRKNDSHIDFSNIVAVYPKQNDQNCHTRILIAVKEGNGTVEREYICQEHIHVLNTITCFLMLSSINKNQ